MMEDKDRTGCKMAPDGRNEELKEVSKMCKTPKSSGIIAGLTAVLVIAIALATIIAAFSGASPNLVFTLIFLGVAISAMVYGFLLIHRILRLRADAIDKKDEDTKKTKKH